MTNEYRIKHMNADELAEFLDDFNCKYCDFSDRRYGRCTILHDNKSCIDGIKNWLLEEVKK